MWKFIMFLECFELHVLFLLASSPSVNSKEIPMPRMCAVCLEKDCATGVRIYSAGSDTAIWARANSQTAIQNCSMENIKPDAPCKMANGSLVQLANETLHFEGMNAHTFKSQISPCTDLNLPPSSTPSPGMCAVCLEKDCTNGVREISPAGSDAAVWVKANSPTAIQNCSMENLKADAPCMMANGSLVQLADKPPRFEGVNPRDERHTFHSHILPCADLNLPSKPSPAIKASIHNTPTPAAPNISVADNKDSGSGSGSRIGIGGGIGIFFGIVIVIVIVILIGVLIWKCNSRGQGQDGDHRHGNNGVPPHDAEDRDENTIEKQPLKGEVPNGNVNGVH